MDTFRGDAAILRRRNGTESEFENFDVKIQDALDVSISRDDREVFVIENPEPDTAEKAKAWLEAFRDTAGMSCFGRPQYWDAMHQMS